MRVVDNINRRDSRRYIGCCGAYCKTCSEFTSGRCRGCKLGFDTGERDVSRAKCKIKLCCFRDKGLETCAECTKLELCEIIGRLYAHKGYKYRKYDEAIEFIKEYGYEEFVKRAGKWRSPYGKLE